MREDSTKLPATSRMAGFFPPRAHQPRVRLAGETLRKWQRAWNLGRGRERRVRAERAGPYPALLWLDSAGGPEGQGGGGGARAGSKKADVSRNH